MIIEEKIWFALDLNFNPVLHTINDFLLLLLHSGYLTSCEDSNYFRIPSKELKEYFYRCYLPIILEKYSGQNNTLESAIKGFSEHLDDFEKYKEDVDNLLSHKKFIAKNESDFKEYFGGIQKISQRFTNFSRHIQYSAQYTNYYTRLNHIFLPLKGKSNIAIIHEYKQTEREIEVNNLLEEGLWQLYAQLYISNILLSMEIEYIKTILTRVIVFYKNCNDNWKANMIQWSHSIHEARKINDFFKKFKRRAELTSGEKILLVRRKFLARMGEDIEDLPACLNKFKEEEKEELQKKEIKGEPTKKAKYKE